LEEKKRVSCKAGSYGSPPFLSLPVTTREIKNTNGTKDAVPEEEEKGKRRTRRGKKKPRPAERKIESLDDDVAIDIENVASQNKDSNLIVESNYPTPSHIATLLEPSREDLSGKTGKWLPTIVAQVTPTDPKWLKDSMAIDSYCRAEVTSAGGCYLPVVLLDIVVGYAVPLQEVFLRQLQYIWQRPVSPPIPATGGLALVRRVWNASKNLLGSIQQNNPGQTPYWSWMPARSPSERIRVHAGGRTDTRTLITNCVLALWRTACFVGTVYVTSGIADDDHESDPPHATCMRVWRELYVLEHAIVSKMTRLLLFSRMNCIVFQDPVRNVSMVVQFGRSRKSIGARDARLESNHGERFVVLTCPKIADGRNSSKRFRTVRNVEDDYNLNDLE